MQASIYRCLSQARINWEGYAAGRAYGVIWGGVHRDCHCLCLHHLPWGKRGYGDGTHGGFGYGSRNADGSRILEFADGLNLVICNTLFTKQEAKLVTYVAGPVKSTVDYIMVRHQDKAMVRNVKVILSEECVPKHKLL